MASKDGSTGNTTKHALIEKASTQVFVTVAIASIVVSMSLVFLNILWGTAQFNTRVQDAQEIARDTLEANLEAVPSLAESFNNLELGDDLIPDQPEDKENSEVVLDALPSVYDFPELATSVNNLAKLSSVKMTEFAGEDITESATSAAVDPEPQPVSFSVEVEGSYSAIAKFLRGIENSIRPMNVKSINLAGSRTKLIVAVTVETVYQPAVDLTIQKRTIQ